MLDVVDKTLERLKVLYEQYFLGIQKQAPAFIHNDVERKLRDLAQLQIRNTGLRYRLATLQQKFGAYNAYWRRTLRQIEAGTYVRNLSKIGRQAVRSGENIPEEILAAMPKRMREQVVRDRDQALAAQARRKKSKTANGEQTAPRADEDDGVAMVGESTGVRRNLLRDTGAHVIETDESFDIEEFFASVEQETEPVVPAPAPAPARPANPALQTGPVPVGPRASDLGPRPESVAKTGPVPTVPKAPLTGPVPKVTAPQSQAIPKVLAPQTQAMPKVPPPAQTGPVARGPRPEARGPSAAPTQAMPKVPPPPQTQAMPKVPPPAQAMPKVPPPPAAGDVRKTQPLPVVPRPPSQATRPNPIAPGAAASRGAVAVESMSGPFPRAAPPKGGAEPRSAKPARPEPPPQQKPPPGMTEADVNALYAKYVKAKEMIGESVGPGGYSKLLQTISSQAPRIMDQYKSKGVDFSVVVKDNQVVIRAKPKG